MYAVDQTCALNSNQKPLLSGLITGVFEKTRHLQCFAARIFGVDLKSRPQVSCRISERLSIHGRRVFRGPSEIAIGYPGSPGIVKRQYYDWTTHVHDFCISEKLYLTGVTAELKGRQFKRQPETVDSQGF